jgi:hypothetical protein
MNNPKFKPGQEVAMHPRIISDLKGQKLKVIDYNQRYDSYDVLIVTGEYAGDTRDMMEMHLVPYESLALLSVIDHHTFDNYVATEQKLKVRRDHLLGVALGKTPDLHKFEDFELWQNVRILKNANIITPWSRWPTLNALDAGDRVGSVYAFSDMFDYDKNIYVPVIRVSWSSSLHASFLPQHLEIIK